MTKVLIVEDEVIIAQSLARMLKRLGYDVVEMVTSGEDAIQAAHRHRPDIILMDIVIQGQINGIQAAAAIGDTYDIPVIYVTAYTDEQTLQKIRHVGGYGFLVKPFKREQLHAAIQLALGQYQRLLKAHKLNTEDELEILLNRDGILSFGRQLFSCAHPSLVVIAAVVLRLSTAMANSSASILSNNTSWVRTLLTQVKPNLEEQDLIGRLTGNEFLLLSYMRSADESESWVHHITTTLTHAFASSSSQAESGQETKAATLDLQVGYACSAIEEKKFDSVLQRAYHNMESAPKATIRLPASF